MNHREIGKSGVKVSELIFGCWSMGGDYFGAVNDSESVRCIRTSIEAGVDSFDNAELYGDGRAEEVLGKALQGIDRSKLTLISKAWTTHFGKEEMVKACVRTLRRLCTDYLDIYFLHYPPKEQSIAEAMENIGALKEKGLIRAVGVSNFSLEELNEAQKYGVVDVIQPCYSLLWRYIDRDILPYCIENGIGVIPYSTLAQGLLTGRFHKDSVFDDGRRKAALFQPGIYEKCLEVADFVVKTAAKYGKTAAQAGINWLINTPGITAPIVGGTNERHALENTGAADFTLSAEDYRAIDEKSRVFTDNMPEFELFFNSNIKV